MLISIGCFAGFLFGLFDSIVGIAVTRGLRWICLLMGLVDCVGVLVLWLLWWLIWVCVAVMFVDFCGLCCVCLV